MTYENLLFDLDGTLTDPRVGITKSFAHALECMGRTTQNPDDFVWCIGPPLHKSFLRVLGDETLVHLAVAHYRQRYVELGMYENKIYDHIPETLAELKAKGCRLVSVTSKLNTIAVQILQHFAIDHHFDAVYGSEFDGTRGDKTELISFMLKQENITPSSCVMIGDREHDMIGARNNQICGWGVAWGYGSHDELTMSGAERVFLKPQEIVVAAGRSNVAR